MFFIDNLDRFGEFLDRAGIPDYAALFIICGVAYGGYLLFEWLDD